MRFSIDKNIEIRNIPDAIRLIADYLEGSMIDEFEMVVDSNIKRSFPRLGRIRGGTVNVSIHAKFKDPMSYQILEYRIDEMR